MFFVVCCQCGETALLFAVRKGNVRMVQLLLNNGANVDEEDFVWNLSYQNLPCLFLSILLGGAYFMLYFVQNGDTALLKAAASGNVEIVELLLKTGADINVKNNVSAHVVAYCGQFLAVICLLSNLSFIV